MTEHNLTCILCPLSCSLLVKEDEGQIIEVSGYSCKLGREYAPGELFNPSRVVTSTVKIAEGSAVRLPVKTSSPVPKGNIFACMQEIRKITVNLPIESGQVIKKGILGSDIDLISTSSIPDKII